MVMRTLVRLLRYRNTEAYLGDLRETGGAGVRARILAYKTDREGAGA